jgi:hypothetical protein
LIKILRIIKLQKKLSGTNFMHAKKAELAKNVKKLIMTSLILLFTTHLSACLWFFGSSLLGVDEDSWIWAQDLVDAKPTHQYLVAFYWAF